MKLLVFLLGVMVILEGYQIKCCLQNERDGLLQIKSYFSSISNGSDPFPTWAVGDEKSDCCEWERVKCSPSTSHVTHLFLNSTLAWAYNDQTYNLNMTVFHPFQELSTLNLSMNNSIQSLVQSEDDNHFGGTLKESLKISRGLFNLDISNNKSIGAILPCFQKLSFGALQGDLSTDYENSIGGPYLGTLFNMKNQDFLEGDENIECDRFEEVDFIVKNRYASYKNYVLSIMSTLDLSCNQLTGVIPPELGDVQKINALNFSHNRLSGPIPKSFSKLRGLESLDLSHNELSGAIPLELVDLNFLGTFNVSYNNLSGQVPETGQFGDFDESNYGRNPLLCGSLLFESCWILKPPPSPSAELGDDGDTSGFDFEVFF